MTLKLVNFLSQIMEIKFCKYQGAGNDFIVIDDRDQKLTHLPVADWCHRRTGIGADGLMLLRPDTDSDFRMIYYNSDGRESTFCGNGGRCLAAFAHQLGLGKDGLLHFAAMDGPHVAHILNAEYVSLKMNNVSEVKTLSEGYEIQTGSPHYVSFVEGLQDWNVKEEGARIRNSPAYVREGINVNFVEIGGPQSLLVRTYERGVEDETLSCGTGVTACALAYAQLNQLPWGAYKVDIEAPGGSLQVEFVRNQNGFEDVYLKGPAKLVFTGTIVL